MLSNDWLQAMVITSTITNTHFILSAEIKSDSCIEKKVFFMQFEFFFFFSSMKPKYIETAMGMENSDTVFFQASIKNEDTAPE